jgi:tRNA threonylcarbamoyladenosine biosynthesis protein TsaE
MLEGKHKRRPMAQEQVTRSAEETRRLGFETAGRLRGGTTLALRGDLGAGKTTFSQGLLEGLGAEGPYSSPTFVIMRQYDLPKPSAGGIRRVYHVDAYRIGSAEIQALGWGEWTEDPEGLVLLEWPERIEEVLSSSVQNVSFEWLDDSQRKIVFR